MITLLIILITYLIILIHKLDKKFSTLLNDNKIDTQVFRTDLRDILKETNYLLNGIKFNTYKPFKKNIKKSGNYDL